MKNLSTSGGKGDSQRPAKVDRKQFEDNWDKIFGNAKKNTLKDTKPIIEEEVL
jgi:hypothetical protein